jgi:hypothetical protein
MPVSDLSLQYISSSYQTLLQVSSSGVIFNGTGSQVNNLTVTASYAATSSNATSIRCLSTAPTPTIGSIYFNTASGSLYYYNGTAWRSITNS